ncbi:hypothetical protein ES705_42630 [subsurface metagenome]
MAYKKADMIKQSLKAIEENNLVFVEEIIAFVPFSKRTFYDHKLHECDAIKKALDDNRIRIKAGLRKEWRTSKSPALQIALYRLLATESEYDRLILQKVDHTSKGESLRPLEISVDSPETKDELNQLINGEPNTGISKE